MGDPDKNLRSVIKNLLRNDFDIRVAHTSASCRMTFSVVCKFGCKLPESLKLQFFPFHPVSAKGQNVLRRHPET